MKNNYPLHDNPIYDFHLSPNKDSIIRDDYAQYECVKITGHSNITSSYRFYTPNGVVFKTNRQLDRYLNGHYYTFDPDEDKARQAILGYYRQKAADAQEIVASCQETLEKLGYSEGPALAAVLSEDNIILDMLDVENYDENFETTFDKYVQEWNDTNCNFDSYIYGRLKESGYRFRTREFTELQTNI